MERLKKWKKTIISFFIGYLIFLLISFISQIQFYQELKTLKLDINLKEIILHTMRNGILIYTALYFLIFTLNALYNLRLAKKLNKESEKIRNLSEEKILKERRSFNMKKKILEIILAIIIIIYGIFSINLIRKVIILDKYSKVTEERSEQKNSYGKIKMGDSGSIYEEYIKGDVILNKRTSTDGTTSVFYKNNEIFLIISESKKIAYKYKQDDVAIGAFSGGDIYFTSFRINNLLEKLRAAYETKITTEYVNGEECYRMYIRDDLQSYVKKDDFVVIKWANGARVKMVDGVEVSEPFECNEVLDYSFGKTTDEDVKIPDLEGYTIEER